MTRDPLYQEMQASFEREARSEARDALRWVLSGMTTEFEPSPVAELVRLAARAPLQLTDEHFARARDAGRDEDAVFELVVAAAMGAGLARRERALAALRKGAAP